MTYHRIFNYSNRTDVTSGTGSAYPSETPQFTPVLKWCSCCSIFIFLCSALNIIVLFLLPALLRFMASDYPFGDFKFFCIRSIVHTIFKNLSLSSFFPYKRKLLNQNFLEVKLNHLGSSTYGRQHGFVNRCRISIANDHVYMIHLP